MVLWVTALSASDAHAQSGELISPYFQVIVDTSGSMGGCSGCATVPNSCGQPTTRLNAAKCVLSSLINAYAGDAAFGLSEFDMGCGKSGGDDVYSATCGSDGQSADAGRTLVPLGTDNDGALLSYVDFLPAFSDPLGLSCPGSDSPNEILVNNENFGRTALAGTLRAARGTTRAAIPRSRAARSPPTLRRLPALQRHPPHRRRRDLRVGNSNPTDN